MKKNKIIAGIKDEIVAKVFELERMAQRFEGTVLEKEAYGQFVDLLFELTRLQKTLLDMLPVSGVEQQVLNYRRLIAVVDRVLPKLRELLGEVD